MTGQGSGAPRQRDEVPRWHRSILVGGMDLSRGGQARNIEMGVLIDDPGLATRLVHQWRGLIESGLVARA